MIPALLHILVLLGIGFYVVAPLAVWIAIFYKDLRARWSVISLLGLMLAIGLSASFLSFALVLLP